VSLNAECGPVIGVERFACRRGRVGRHTLLLFTQNWIQAWAVKTLTVWCGRQPAISTA
jgi:hypothetical protein